MSEAAAELQKTNLLYDTNAPESISEELRPVIEELGLLDACQHLAREGHRNQLPGGLRGDVGRQCLARQLAEDGRGRARRESHHVHPNDVPTRRGLLRARRPADRGPRRQNGTAHGTSGFTQLPDRLHLRTHGSYLQQREALKNSRIWQTRRSPWKFKALWWWIWRCPQGLRR
jgi:hypothetical protein